VSNWALGSRYVRGRNPPPVQNRCLVDSGNPLKGFLRRMLKLGAFVVFYIVSIVNMVGIFIE
jgi:hypothetical protein